MRERERRKLDAVLFTRIDEVQIFIQ